MRGITPESSPRLLALSRPGIAFSHCAFGRAKLPEISWSPSLPSLGSRNVTLTSFASMHITFSVPAGTRGVSCPPGAEIPVCFEQQQMDTGLSVSLSGPQSCPTGRWVTLGPKPSSKQLF